MTGATWQDEYLVLIVDCEHREQRLTDWERTFIGEQATKRG